MEDKYGDYIVYVDESGDANLDKINENFPVFVLTFMIVKKSIYAEKIMPSIAKLKFETFGHDMVILHERDIRKQLGQFKGLNHPEAFLCELTKIIDDAELTLIAVVIKKKEFIAKYKNPYEPYELAMTYGLERLYSFLRTKGQEEKETFIVVESRGKKEDASLELSFRRICDSNTHNTHYVFKLIMAQKAVNSGGLQIADLTARPIGLYVMRPDQSNRTYEILEKKFWTGIAGATFIGNGLKIFP